MPHTGPDCGETEANKAVPWRGSQSSRLPQSRRAPRPQLTSSSRPHWVSGGLRTARQCRSGTDTAPLRLWQGERQEGWGGGDTRMQWGRVQPKLSWGRVTGCVGRTASVTVLSSLCLISFSGKVSTWHGGHATIIPAREASGWTFQSVGCHQDSAGHSTAGLSAAV